MAITKYFESGNRYTDPVRYFKANDPYYYEVDNIPIKQLEENSNFLKDQVDGLIEGRSDLGRDRLTELQPYVDATNSKVKVKPGRFSARINDAVTLPKLQFISQVLGIGDGSPNTYRCETNTGPNVGPILAKWHLKQAENATSMNGLFERTFVYPMTTSDISDDGATTTPGFGGVDIHPGFQGRVWPSRTSRDYYYYSIFGRTVDSNGIPQPFDPSEGFRKNGRVESAFIKRWRGVARTAIVDVPSELEIEIPAFDSTEFFYIDSAGVSQPLDSTQRIDLVFIYSKPIDQPSTKVPSYAGGSARTLTAPALGIVKGAGVGLDRRTSTSFSNIQNVVDLQSLEGVTLMLPNPSDELQDDTGFQTSAGVAIRGSFPSPDDLMNLAPLLAENLAGGDSSGVQDSVVLLGQSILPVAYVVVKNTASLNANGAAILTVDDLIDIRPFFRTTELAYNERSGIAAATPQVSLANPVVTEAYAEELKYNLKNEISTRIAQSQPLTSSRVVGAGTIKGGMYYGVEGALGAYLKDTQNVTNYNAAKALVESRYGYATNSIPDLPDWDVARWCEVGNFTEKGTFPNDRVNYCQWGLAGNGTPTELLKYGAFSSKPDAANLDAAFTSGGRAPRLAGQESIKSAPRNTLPTNTSEEGITSFYFVEKTIRLDRSQTPWMTDYFVNVQLQNCAPLSCRAGTSQTTNTYISSNGVASIWVDRRDDEFTIFVSWAGADYSFFDAGNVANMFARMPAQNRGDGAKYSGFTVLNSDIMTASNPNGAATGTGNESVTMGTATYPTVSFQIMGVDNSVENASRTSLNQANPVLTLL
tara:strand:- start:717 stop:3161 length:2445 start_codon:yes stop_codon:yes gene_type:complete